MLLKSEIEKAFISQQLILNQELIMTGRIYLEKRKFLGSQVEVIAGIRRCGKSTLMRMIMNNHIPNVAYFNFEDIRVFGFEVRDFQKLDEIIGYNHPVYFFDEIQNVNGWELFVRQLHERGEKVFITGSNASLLSKELGTRLTGRHIRHELFPFNYAEFLEHKQLINDDQAFEKFLKTGGFPEYIENENIEVLQMLLKDIVFRDIAIRHSIKNTKIIMDITHYLISNIGKECTFNSLKKTFSVGSANSVSDYLKWLEDAYLLFFLPRFSWSAKSIAVNPRKVYAIDTGLIQANTLSFTEDKGRLLENVIYLFLRQNYQQIYYFKEKGECDFVVFENKKCKQLIQVCEELHEENKDREINGIVESMDFFSMKEAYIVTKSQKEILHVGKKKIKVVQARDFIL